MQLAKMFALLVTGTLEVYGERRVVVSLQERKMVLLTDGQVVKTYQVAVGKPSTPTPAGTYQIATRISNPTWYGPGKIVGPGKGNPVGTRWMG